MPTTAQPTQRYATALSMPRHLAEHVANQAHRRGLSSAGYIRQLIYDDMEKAKASRAAA